MPRMECPAWSAPHSMLDIERDLTEFEIKKSTIHQTNNTMTNTMLNAQRRGRKYVIQATLVTECHSYIHCSNLVQKPTREAYQYNC